MGVIFLLMVTLGCALGRQGQKCCGSCKSAIDCGACAREGSECRIGSGLCSEHLQDDNVDCSLKTADGQPCCVFSKVSDGCECVQRRCHLHEFPSAKVPSECRGKNMAGQSTWVFGAVLIFVAVMIAAVTIFLRRRRMNSQRKRRQEEERVGGEEGERASDPLKKDPEGDRPLLEEQTSSEQPSSRKM